jgi:hypothetical protein
VNSFADGYRQNIAIIGEPYIGKTSLIKALIYSDQIKRDAVIPVYLETKIEPFEFCAKRFIKSTLYQLLQSGSLPATPHDTVLLIEDLKSVCPKTAQICIKVLQDIERYRWDEAFSSMMDIPAAIFEESKKRCVLIIDEFQNLINYQLKHPYGTLAKKIMIQKDTMFILLSSKNTISHRLLSEKLALLFGNFEKIELGPFDATMSTSFLSANIHGTVFPQGHLDFIASFTGGKPFYIKLLSDEIERTIFSKKTASDNYDELIEIALTEALFKKSGILNQLFSNFLLNISEGKLLSKSVSVLLALSLENKKQNDIVRSSRLQSRDVSKILNKLTDTDIILRNGSFYRFRDKLFCFWLESVYLKRILSFSIDETLEEVYFKKEVNNKLRIFIQEFEKDLYYRIIDLFKLFRNDVVQLNGKRHKFPLFNNVETAKESFFTSIDILATGSRVKWLCSIKKEYVTENDITEIIKSIKMKAHEYRANRNIVICLAGINENAYLIAKDAKFWIWSMEDINILMELYGKPHIG